MLLLCFYLVLAIVVEAGWCWLPQQFVDACDQVSGALTVMGTSIAAALFLGTCALYASYDGQGVAESQFRAADRRYARTCAAFVMEHWFPLLIWLPLYGCRCEVELLTRATRAVLWYVAVLLPITLWIVVVAGAQLARARAVWYESGPFVLSVVTIAVAPWACMVWS
jgi:hypothetical protein